MPAPSPAHTVATAGLAVAVPRIGQLLPHLLKRRAGAALAEIGEVDSVQLEETVRQARALPTHRAEEATQSFVGRLIGPVAREDAKQAYGAPLSNDQHSADEQYQRHQTVVQLAA